jgi:hypothetical protein
VKASEFDEGELFRSIATSGARALLIGRQALIALGIPVLTRDYDYWIHIDDIGPFNQAVSRLGFAPNRSPDEARARGRYVLENDERIDVLVARSVSTVGGVRVAFEDVWVRRERLELAPGIEVELPTLEDLILTKQFGGRPKDAEDLRLLQELLRRGQT